MAQYFYFLNTGYSRLRIWFVLRFTESVLAGVSPAALTALTLIEILRSLPGSDVATTEKADRTFAYVRLISIERGIPHLTAHAPWF